MIYDVATKRIIDKSKESILHRFLGIKTSDILNILELPEETVNIRRSDYPLYVSLKDGQEFIVLIEIQTLFERSFILRLIDYTVRSMLRHNLEVIPVVLLLTPSLQATGLYEDKRLSFKYEVVRFWEKDAENFLDEISLFPFIPLMNGGLELIDEIEKRVYENTQINIEEKADLLSAIVIFTGLKNKYLAARLLERRKDIMIQSPIYEMIKEEGLREGQMIGIKEGSKETAKKLLFDTLELRFGKIPQRVEKSINKVTDIEKLTRLHHSAVKSETIKEFENEMKSILK
ncbi:TPA: hypothetical protein ENX78_11655 [Candidatus Poribacteria bacterium]|nr:hypothetical protein [Candidatus Poribacteria bacterium]